MHLTHHMQIPGRTRVRWAIASVAALAAVGLALTGAVGATAAPPKDDDPFTVEPIDPQDWELQGDMTWDDWKDIPGTSWNDPTVKPSVEALNIALVAVDFPDQKFVITKPKGFADVIAEVLGLKTETVVVRAVAADSIPVAYRHIERGIGAKENPPRKVASGFPCVSNKDLLNVFKSGALETSARDRKRCSLRTRFRIRHIDQIVLCELRMNGNAMERIASLSRWRGRRPHIVGQEHPVAYHPQLTVLLGDEKSPRIGERQTPGMKQARRHRNDANLSALHIEYTGAGVAWCRLLTLDRKREDDHGGCRSS